MGSLFHLQALENFFRRLSLQRHSDLIVVANTEQIILAMALPRQSLTGFSRRHFSLYTRILFVCFANRLQRHFLYEAVMICQQQLCPHGFLQ